HLVCGRRLLRNEKLLALRCAAATGSSGLPMLKPRQGRPLAARGAVRVGGGGADNLRTPRPPSGRRLQSVAPAWRGGPFATGAPPCCAAGQAGQLPAPPGGRRWPSCGRRAAYPAAASSRLLPALATTPAARTPCPAPAPPVLAENRLHRAHWWTRSARAGRLPAAAGAQATAGRRAGGQQRRSGQDDFQRRDFDRLQRPRRRQRRRGHQIFKADSAPLRFSVRHSGMLTASGQLAGRQQRRSWRRQRLHKSCQDCAGPPDFQTPMLSWKRLGLRLERRVQPQQQQQPPQQMPEVLLRSSRVPAALCGLTSGLRQAPARAAHTARMHENQPALPPMFRHARIHAQEICAVARQLLQLAYTEATLEFFERAPSVALLQHPAAPLRHPALRARAAGGHSGQRGGGSGDSGRAGGGGARTATDSNATPPVIGRARQPAGAVSSLAGSLASSLSRQELVTFRTACSVPGPPAPPPFAGSVRPQLERLFPAERSHLLLGLRALHPGQGITRLSMSFLHDRGLRPTVTVAREHREHRQQRAKSDSSEVDLDRLSAPFVVLRSPFPTLVSPDPDSRSPDPDSRSPDAHTLEVQRLDMSQQQFAQPQLLSLRVRRLRLNCRPVARPAAQVTRAWTDSKIPPPWWRRARLRAKSVKELSPHGPPRRWKSSDMAAAQQAGNPGAPSLAAVPASAGAAVPGLSGATCLAALAAARAEQRRAGLRKISLSIVGQPPKDAQVAGQPTQFDSSFAGPASKIHQVLGKLQILKLLGRPPSPRPEDVIGKFEITLPSNNRAARARTGQTGRRRSTETLCAVGQITALNQCSQVGGNLGQAGLLFIRQQIRCLTSNTHLTFTLRLKVGSLDPLGLLHIPQAGRRPRKLQGINIGGAAKRNAPARSVCLNLCLDSPPRGCLAPPMARNFKHSFSKARCALLLRKRKFCTRASNCFNLASRPEA
uniref:Protein kinase domain-containing protein n=1 Tax=Macrostomum lignano TaxID=282301 RepID=A0A1I8JND5_9PLAT